LGALPNVVSSSDTVGAVARPPRRSRSPNRLGGWVLGSRFRPRGYSAKSTSSRAREACLAR
jgi:hypothetical protein